VVLVVWVLSLVLALASAIAHWWRWRRAAYFDYYLRHASTPPTVAVSSVAGGWLRDAVMHLGLRILLVLLAVERIMLQLSTPPAQRGTFAQSPFQLGLALIYLMIIIWSVRWTWLTNQARVRRSEQEAAGRAWFERAEQVRKGDDHE